MLRFFFSFFFSFSFFHFYSPVYAIFTLSLFFTLLSLRRIAYAFQDESWFRFFLFSSFPEISLWAIENHIIYIYKFLHFFFHNFSFLHFEKLFDLLEMGRRKKLIEEGNIWLAKRNRKSRGDYEICCSFELGSSTRYIFNQGKEYPLVTIQHLSKNLQAKIFFFFLFYIGHELLDSEEMKHLLNWFKTDCQILLSIDQSVKHSIILCYDHFTMFHVYIYILSYHPAKKNKTL